MNDIIKAARERARIRRTIRSENDRIADQLDGLCNEIERLRAELASGQRAWEALADDMEELRKRFHTQRAELAEMRELLRNVLIGGNHVALLIGADYPPHTAPWQFGLSHYGAGDKYEAWCCWKTIMQVRDELDRIDATLAKEKKE